MTQSSDPAQLKTIYAPEKTLIHLLSRAEVVYTLNGEIYYDADTLRQWIADNFPVISRLTHAIHEQAGTANAKSIQKKTQSLDELDPIRHLKSYGSKTE
jgi:hypothetical protein